MVAGAGGYQDVVKRGIRAGDGDALPFIEVLGVGHGGAIEYGLGLLPIVKEYNGAEECCGDDDQ